MEAAHIRVEAQQTKAMDVVLMERVVPLFIPTAHVPNLLVKPCSESVPTEASSIADGRAVRLSASLGKPFKFNRS
jgi:hypothetical protein